MKNEAFVIAVRVRLSHGSAHHSTHLYHVTGSEKEPVGSLRQAKEAVLYDMSGREKDLLIEMRGTRWSDLEIL